MRATRRSIFAKSSMPICAAIGSAGVAPAAGDAAPAPEF
jgi:hypothetical protein